MSPFWHIGEWPFSRNHHRSKIWRWLLEARVHNYHIVNWTSRSQWNQISEASVTGGRPAPNVESIIIGLSLDSLLTFHQPSSSSILWTSSKNHLNTFCRKHKPHIWSTHWKDSSVLLLKYVSSGLPFPFLHCPPPPPPKTLFMSGLVQKPHSAASIPTPPSAHSPLATQSDLLKW